MADDGNQRVDVTPDDRSKAAGQGRSAWIVAACLTVVGAVLSTIGIRLPFGYDESVTVAYFVRAPTWTDAITRQVIYNNHPLISLLDHFVGEVFGTTSEPVLRVIPILAFVATAALTGFVVTRWWGWLAGTAAGLLVVTNPTLLQKGTTIRGYSLLVLAALATALVLVHVSRAPRATVSATVAYVAFGAVGLSAHMYMVLVLGVELVACLLVPRLRASRFATWTVVAGMIGAVLQIGLMTTVGGNGRGRHFRASFPIDVVWDVAGTHWLLVAVTVGLLGYGARRWLKVPPFAVLTGVVAAEVAVAWIVAPYDLYPRFFVWLVPFVAIGVVYGARCLAPHLGRWRPGVWVVLAGLAAAQLLVVLPSLSRAQLENRSAAEVLRAASDRGARVCVLSTSAEGLMGYYEVRTVQTEAEMRDCDVVASVVPLYDGHLIDRARAAHPNQVVLEGADMPTTLFTSADASCLTTDPPAGCWSG